MAYEQNIQRVCAKPPYTPWSRNKKSLWQDAPDLVDMSILVKCTIHVPFIHFTSALV